MSVPHSSDRTTLGTVVAAEPLNRSQDTLSMSETLIQHVRICQALARGSLLTPSGLQECMTQTACYRSGALRVSAVSQVLV